MMAPRPAILSLAPMLKSARPRTRDLARGLFLALSLLLLAAPAFAQTDVDDRSLMTTPVWLLRGSQPISQGTGFFYASTTPSEEIETVFLVTNYHVVTGYSPQSQGRKGDHIRLILHRNRNDLRDVQAVDLPLYDERDQPLWIASEQTPNADVVLVPLPRRVYERLRLLVFTEAHTRGDIKIRPTSGATLLGYPFGFYDTTHYLPVWKTGHIASEPDVDFEGRPVFLVDVSAFPGMSVLACRLSAWPIFRVWLLRLMAGCARSDAASPMP